MSLPLIGSFKASAFVRDPVVGAQLLRNNTNEKYDLFGVV
jgi:hypothetical protein